MSATGKTAFQRENRILPSGGKKESGKGEGNGVGN